MTFVKYLVLLVIGVMVLLIFNTFVNNFESYNTTSQAGVWVWRMATAILSSLGLKLKKKRSLPEFLDLLPTKIGIVAYAVVTVFFFVLTELPVHTVRVKSLVDGVGRDGVRIAWPNRPKELTEDSILEIKEIKVGKYRLSYELEGYRTLPMSVEVSFWQLIVPVYVEYDSKKDSAFGRLYVESYVELEPSHAAIFLTRNDTTIIPMIGDKPPQTPDTLSRLRPGVYELTVTKQEGKGSYSKTTRIEIETDRLLTRTLQLPYVPSPKGKVTIGSEPAGADIYIDGRYINKQTPATITRDSGYYTVVLRKKVGIKYGYVLSKGIYIKGHSSVMLGTYDFEEEHMRRLRELYITSAPQAQIFVDGKYEGQTNANEPIHLFVSGVPNEVILKEYGYHDWIVDVSKRLPF
ncbi:PEGA domain-containing protein, partial [Candidatus Pacearchaeota archaeon]|nr:PEGA domain-containing protein [Candidatus Pacearchaeota archaeon]